MTVVNEQNNELADGTSPTATGTVAGCTETVCAALALRGADAGIRLPALSVDF